MNEYLDMAHTRKKTFYRNSDSRHQTRILDADEVVSRVREMAAPVCESEGLELVHVEYQRESSGRVLRIYIDKSGGVRLDDCVDISRQLNDVLDVGLEHQGAYRLEVTSPGPDRPLGDQAAFEKFTGHKARIQVARPVNGQKTFTGTIGGISDQMVMISKDESSILIPLIDITRARLVDYHGEDTC